MKLAFLRQTQFGGWIVTLDANGKAKVLFGRVFMNRPRTRTVDPELQAAVALMVAAPDLRDALQTLRDAVMRDCEISSASAETFAAALAGADTALLKSVGVL